MKNRELENKYIEQLKEILRNQHLGNYDEDHESADNILCSFLKELGYKKIVKIFDEIEKWYA